MLTVIQIRGIIFYVRLAKSSTVSFSLLPVNFVTSALEFSTNGSTRVCASARSQLIPSFSTVTKRFARTHGQKHLSLGSLVRDSLYAPGAVIHCDPVAPTIRRTPINHLETALTNPPVSAGFKTTYTRPKSFGCNTYKNQGGALGWLTPRNCHHHRPLTTHAPHHSATLCLRGTP